MSDARVVSVTGLLEENRALRERLERVEEMLALGRAGIELKERLQIEEALADCSRLFARPGEVNIDHILELIGKAVDAHRACIYELVSGTMMADNTYEWCAPGISSKMKELKTVDMDMFTWSLGEIMQGRVVNIPDATELPPEARNESEILIWGDIYSLVAVPIYNADNDLTAWMGFVDTVKARNWREEDIRCLHVIAEMLSIYWGKKNTEREILHRLEVEEAIADCSRLLVWDEEVDLNHLLGIVGKAVNASRVCIFDYNRDDVAVCRYEWCNADIPPLDTRLRTLDLNKYPWAITQIKTDQILIIEDSEDLPLYASNEKLTMQSSDVASLLAVPIWDGDHNLKALMGYGDRLLPRKWQNEDLRCLQVVAEMLGTYWERKSTEEEVLHRLVIEEAIAEASRRFLRGGEADIYEIIELIGVAVKANQAYVFENDEKTNQFACTYEWNDGQTESHIKLLKNLDHEIIQWWLDRLSAGKTIVLSQGNWLSEVLLSPPDILAHLDAESLVMVPIFDSSQKLLAILGFDDVHGRRAWLEEDIRCLRMVGEILGAYWERQQTEKALRHSEAMFRLLADMSPAFTYITNLDAYDPLLYYNRAVSKLSGYSYEEIENMNPWLIYHPDDIPMLLERGAARMRGEAVPSNYEVRFIKKDGSVGYGLLNSAQIKWEGERALITIIHDITGQKNLLDKLTQARDQLELMVLERTSELIRVNRDLYTEINERKQIEEELRQSEANFKKLAEASPALICVVDNDYLRYINSAGESMLGFSREECLYKRFSSIVHEDYRDQFIASCRGREEGKYIPPYELKLLHRDGQEIWGILSGDIIEYEGVRCNIGAILDITEHKKMEEELMRKERLETLGLLAGGIAHDFNNILTIVSGNASLAQMILTGQEDDEIPILLDDIKTAAMQATRLTNQLLTFSKGGAPVKQSLAVPELVMEAVRFALAGSNIKCTFSFAEDLWPIDVDREQISQVINQLVSNACQSMPQGGEIRLEISNQLLSEPTLALPPGKFVRIAVIDQGLGIDDSTLPKIFNPYFTTKETGRGMGLAVTDSIVRRHGGSINVKPNPDQGTTFEVLLPASLRSLQTGSAEEAVGMGGQGRILVMDDEEYIRIILGRMLKKLGYEAYMACDGQEAIDYYTRGLNSGHPFDAVIMDLTIPGGMGGSEAVQKLLKIDPGLKAIVSSGYSGDPIMANYLEYGFRGVIPKPYEISKLNRVLHEVLCGRSA